MSPDESKDNGFVGQNLRALILTYHVIGPAPSAYVYSTTCQKFDQHMELVASRAANRYVPGQSASVTFDDGKATDHEYALPILQKYGIRATFFVTAGLIEHQPGFMTWGQVKELASLGHAVESHGWSHALLNRADEGELYEELNRSKKELEDRLGLPVESISLPGGRWTPHVLKACANAGYQRVYHSDPWRQVQHLGNMEFCGRFMVRNTTSVDTLRGLLEGNHSTILYYRTQHKLKEFGKQFLGDRFYHRIWQTVARIAGQDGPRKPY